MIWREAVTAGQLARGDATALRADEFAQLVDQSLATAYRLASVLLGSESEAQDAVQDAATVAWLRFDTLRDLLRFEAWFQRFSPTGAATGSAGEDACGSSSSRTQRLRPLPEGSMASPSMTYWLEPWPPRVLRTQPTVCVAS